NYLPGELLGDAASLRYIHHLQLGYFIIYCAELQVLFEIHSTFFAGKILDIVFSAARGAQGLDICLAFAV
ncbi:MAG: hypothetical protein IJ189_13240, partial [Clostridia bacterium]|nr:hypothetical protein [Clostridia bacterium]